MPVVAEGRRDDPALVLPSGDAITYGELPSLTAGARRHLGALPGRSLVLLFAVPGPDTVAWLLAARETGHAVLLADPALGDPATARLFEAYEPELVVRGTQVTRRRGGAPPPHEDLALLMMTSGSTGQPQAVALSGANLDANAGAIVTALNIAPGDRAVTSLPLHYCYGLSVLTSHLRAGAAVVLTGDPPTGRPFWRTAAASAATTFAGVPMTYEALLPLLSSRWPATLRTITQAGGALRREVAERLAHLATDAGAHLFVMYGQTEATARMSVHDVHRFPGKLGSAGRPVPGGSFTVDAGHAVRYRGPNVMLGYASSRADLALGDRMRGELDTGDLGRLDEDGFLWLHGRRKRIVKVAGRRVGLDEVEQALSAVSGPVAAVPDGDGITVWCCADAGAVQARGAAVCAELGLPPVAIRVRETSSLPRTPTNKIDYPLLTTLTRGRTG